MSGRRVRVWTDGFATIDAAASQDELDLEARVRRSSLSWRRADLRSMEANARVDALSLQRCRERGIAIDSWPHGGG